MELRIKRLRYSLVIVWLATALVSLLDYQGTGAQLLIRGGISDGVYIKVLIAFGALADLLIGLLLWLKPVRCAYLMALGLMLLMTAIASVLLPNLWLDPLGPLLKNLPIAALLLFLYQGERRKCSPT